MSARVRLVSGCVGPVTGASINHAINRLAKEGGGTVHLGAGEFTCWDEPITMKPGVWLEGEGRGVTVLHAHVRTTTGTLGDAVTLTAAVAAGATTLPLTTTGLAAGDWLRLASCVNCGSADAGIWQLGDREADDSYLAEFAKVNSITNGGALELFSGTMFPYSDTAGADSDASITASVAFKVAFHEGGGLRHLSLIGANGEDTIVNLTLCRGFRIEDCEIDSDGAVCNNVRLSYCLDCHITGGRITGYKTGAGSSDGNQIHIRSSTLCTLDGVTLEHGNQALDITYVTNDMVYRGGPSIMCGASNCQSYHAITDAFTDHPGCYLSTFDNCRAWGTGFRLRGRGSRASNCNAAAPPGAGIGFYLTDAAAIDGGISGGNVRGFLFGVEYKADKADYDALFGLTGGGCTIEGLTCYQQGGDALFFDTGSTTATRRNTHVHHVTIHAPADDGVTVYSYNNGLRLEQVSVYEAADDGIVIGNDIKGLHIEDFRSYGCTGTPIQGSAAPNMITDATTFPGGEAEAELYIGRVFTDDAVVTADLTADPAAYAQSSRVGFSGVLVPPAATELTIASGVVTVYGNDHLIDTEADAATDDLDTINGGAQNQIVVLRAASSDRTVVVRDTTGNLNLTADFSLTHTADRLVLQKNGTIWYELSRADNGV